MTGPWRWTCRIAKNTHYWRFIISIKNTHEIISNTTIFYFSALNFCLHACRRYVRLRDKECHPNTVRSVTSVFSLHRPRYVTAEAMQMNNAVDRTVWSSQHLRLFPVLTRYYSVFICLAALLLIYISPAVFESRRLTRTAVTKLHISRSHQNRTLLQHEQRNPNA
jgi:hypothetical protein